MAAFRPTPAAWEFVGEAGGEGLDDLVESAGSGHDTSIGCDEDVDLGAVGTVTSIVTLARRPVVPDDGDCPI